jgi:hypothetical protein
MHIPKKVFEVSRSSDDTEGFFYYNPDHEYDTSMQEYDPKTQELDLRLKLGMRRFLLINLFLVAINILMISYWLSGIDVLSKSGNNNNNGSNKEASSQVITSFILSLMIVHFVWIVNFLLGYNFLKYEFNKGVIVYFALLNLIFFIRITINLFILLTEKTVREYMGGSFNVLIYVMAVVIQTFGDVSLTVLAAKIKYLTKLISDMKDKKLMNVSIQNIQVIKDIEIPM